MEILTFCLKLVGNVEPPLVIIKPAIGHHASLETNCEQRQGLLNIKPISISKAWEVLSRIQDSIGELTLPC